MAHGEDFDPRNYRRYELINKIFHYGIRDAEFDSLSTDESNITPFKIGYLTDLHWGITSDSWVSNATKQSKLDEFANEMNSWGADYVILGGDNTAGQTSKSDGQSDITDLRDYIEPQLDMPLKPMWGNHEYKNADTWGADWSYAPWDISSDSDTYYSIDDHHAKVILLNTGYDTTDTLDSGVPSGQLSWLKNELAGTDKPVLVFCHTPPQLGGSMVDYDSIGLLEMEKYTAEFDKHDNIVGVWFGHSHHESQDGKPSASFNHSFQQTYGNTRYIFQHYPNGIGGSQNDADSTGLDTNITPYAKINVYQDGHVWVQQSYDDADLSNAGELPSEVRTNWRFNGSPRASMQTQRTLSPTTFEYEDPITSTEGYDSSATTTNSSVFISNPNPGYLALQTGEDVADTAKAVMGRKLRPNETGSFGWPDMIFWAILDMPTVNDWSGYLTVGGTGTSEHIGFRMDDGLSGTVADGSTQNTINVETPSQPTYYQIRHFADKGRVDFSSGSDGGVGRTKVAVDQNVPTGAPSRIFNGEVNNKINASRELRVYGWGIRLAPTMDFQG